MIGLIVRVKSEPLLSRQVSFMIVGAMHEPD